MSIPRGQSSGACFSSSSNVVAKLNVSINCMVVANRRFLFLGCGDGLIQRFNLVDQIWLESLKGHSGYISCLEVCTSGVRLTEDRCEGISDPVLFSSSLDGSIRVWRIGNTACQFVTALQHHRRKPVHKILVDQKQRHLYTASSDKTVCRLDLDKLADVPFTLCELDDWVACMALLGSARLLVGLGGGGLYEIDAGASKPQEAVLRKFSGHTKITTSVAVSQGCAFSVGGDGFLRCWDLKQGSMCFETDIGSPIYAMRTQHKQSTSFIGAALQVLASGPLESGLETTIILGTKSGKLLRFDAMGRQLHCYVDHGATVFDLASGLNGELLSTGQNGDVFRTIPVFRCEFCLKSCKANGRGCLPGTCSCCGSEFYEPELSHHCMNCIQEKCLQCGEAIPKGKSVAHVVSCPAAPTQCSWPGCGAWVPRFSLQCHEEKECLYREVCCPNKPCDHIVPLCHLDEHIQQCPYRPVEPVVTVADDVAAEKVCSLCEEPGASQEEKLEPMPPRGSPKTPAVASSTKPTSQQSQMQPSRLSALVVERRVGGGFATESGRFRLKQRASTSACTPDAMHSSINKSQALKRFASIGSAVTGSLRLSRQRDSRDSDETPRRRNVRSSSHHTQR